MVTTTAKVKTWAQGPIDDYELTFVTKKQEEESKSYGRSNNVEM
jgi:hypothetical protein